MLACPIKVVLDVVELFTSYRHVKVCDALTSAPKPARNPVPENELSVPKVCEKLVWLSWLCVGEVAVLTV